MGVFPRALFITPPADKILMGPQRAPRSLFLWRNQARIFKDFLDQFVHLVYRS